MAKLYDKFIVMKDEYILVATERVDKKSNQVKVMAIQSKNSKPNRFSDAVIVNDMSNITDAELNLIFNGVDYKQIGEQNAEVTENM